MLNFIRLSTIFLLSISMSAQEANRSILDLYEGRNVAKESRHNHDGSEVNEFDFLIPDRFDTKTSRRTHHTTTPMTETHVLTDSVALGWVQQFGSGLGSSSDEATAIAIDTSGFVYVTGASNGESGYADWTTVKYSPGGDEIWVSKFNGPANGDDFARHIVVGSGAEVYVAGTIKSAMGDNDIAAVKINSDGTQNWSVTYAGTFHDADFISGLALDSEENLIVLGSTSEEGEYDSFTIIKYDSAGNQLWLTHFSDEGIGANNGTAMVVDNAGNIIVTGNSSNENSATDWVTLKYDPGGNEIWRSTYNGPGSSSSSIGLDYAGNIITTGSGTDEDGFANLTTIKYDANGNEIWVSLHSGLANGNISGEYLDIDENGNVLILGSTRTDGWDDLFLVKLDENGTVQWTQSYDGPANHRDIPAGIKIDNNHNIVVSGKSRGLGTIEDYVIIKYDSTGDELWINRYDGPTHRPDRPSAPALDSMGNIYITGGSYGESRLDFSTLKYSPDGTEIWNTRYNELGVSVDVAKDMKIDPTGNIIVVGSSEGAGGDEDYLVLKYNNDGSLNWNSRYDGPALQDDTPHALALDSMGNIFVTGESRGLEVFTELTSLKFTQEGSQVWVDRYGGLDDRFHIGEAISIDDTGTLVVAGNSTSNIGFYDFVTMKHNHDGGLAWVARYDGEANSSDQISDMIIDSEGNIVVTGSSVEELPAGDIATIKYSSDGDLMWVATYGGGANGIDKGKSLALGPDGSIYVTGYIYEEWDGYDCVTIKYDAEGNEIWANSYDGPGNGSDNGVKIAIGIDGQVYVAGSTTAFAGDSDYLLISYDSDGETNWVTTYSGIDNMDDYCRDLTFDTAGNIYVTGHSETGELGREFVTVKYNQSGSESWIARYNSVGSDEDYVNSIQVDLSGNIFVSGSTFIGSSAKMTTIKYLQPNFVSILGSEDLPISFTLSQNYPNPFNPITTIKYEIPEQTNCSLIVYDLIGRSVRTLVSSQQSSGSYSVNWDGTDQYGHQVSGGMYIARLHAGNQLHTIKLVYLR